jgi:hypothetical protein
MTKLVSTVLVAVFALSSFASDIKIKYDDYIEELKHRNKKRYEKYKKRADESYNIAMNSGILVANNGRLVYYTKITYRDIVKSLEDPIIKLYYDRVEIEGKIKGYKVEIGLSINTYKRSISTAHYKIKGKFTYSVPSPSFTGAFILYSCDISGNNSVDDHYSQCNDLLIKYFGK